MNTEQIASMINSREVLPTEGITLWLSSGEKLTGTGFTYDVSGYMHVEQAGGISPIVVSLDHIVALQGVAYPP